MKLKTSSSPRPHRAAPKFYAEACQLINRAMTGKTTTSEIQTWLYSIKYVIESYDARNQRAIADQELTAMMRVRTASVNNRRLKQYLISEDEGLLQPNVSEDTALPHSRDPTSQPSSGLSSLSSSPSPSTPSPLRRSTRTSKDTVSSDFVSVLKINKHISPIKHTGRKRKAVESFSKDDDDLSEDSDISHDDDRMKADQESSME